MAKAKSAPASRASAGPRTYKLIELVGTSNESYEKAIENAIHDASRTVRGLAWFEVGELRGQIRDGAIAEYQVKVKIGFRILEKE